MKERFRSPVSGTGLKSIMGLHGEDDVVACPGVSLVPDQLTARLGIHISRGSMSPLERLCSQTALIRFMEFSRRLVRPDKLSIDKEGR